MGMQLICKYLKYINKYIINYAIFHFYWKFSLKILWNVASLIS